MICSHVIRQKHAASGCNNKASAHLDNDTPGGSDQLPGRMVGPILGLKVGRVAVAEVTETEAGWNISHKTREGSGGLS